MDRRLTQLLIAHPWMPGFVWKYVGTTLPLSIEEAVSRVGCTRLCLCGLIRAPRILSGLGWQPTEARKGECYVR